MPERTPLTSDGTLYFMHIPKTAGSTLITLLKTYFETSDICPPEICRFWQSYEEHVEDGRPLPYRLIYGHLLHRAMDHMQPPIRTMTFLRHPVARSISQYRQYQRTPDTVAYEAANQLSLAEFLEDPQWYKWIVNISLQYLSNNTRDIDLARRNLESLDFVGLTERFDESLAMFFYQFCLPPHMDYQKQNVSPNKSKTIDDAIYERLMELNEDELVVYNHGVELFETRYQAFLKRLIQRDYEERGFFIASAGPQAEVQVDMQTVLQNGRGWYPGHPHDTHGMVWWSGPDTISVIYLNLEHDLDYRIDFLVVNYLDQAIVDSLTILANGHPIDLEQTHIAGTTHRFQGLIQNMLLKDGKPLRLTFQISKTIPALDPNSQEQLGLCYADFSIKVTSL